MQPAIYALMWARDASGSFLRPPDAMRAAIERAGFRARAWDDVTADTAGTPGPPPAHAAQVLIMGDTLPAIMAAGQRNREEGRIVMVQAVFDRVP